MAPNINIATEKILNHIGIGVTRVSQAQCCGAISHHLNKHEYALQTLRNNIDAWWPHIENGCEAIVSNASGCGVMLKDYGEQLAHDPHYADKAKTISSLTKDISEVITDEDTDKLVLRRPCKVTFHAPCTLQHGLRLKDRVEKLLELLGMELMPVSESHLCCGSAGTYSILQPGLSTRLKQRKLKNLLSGQPQYIVTANIGCQHHLQSASNIPVVHWVELIAENI